MAGRKVRTVETSTTGVVTVWYSVVDIVLGANVLVTTIVSGGPAGGKQSARSQSMKFVSM